MNPERQGQQGRPPDDAEPPSRDFVETVATGVATNLVTAAMLFLIAQVGGLIGAHPALTVVAAAAVLGYGLLAFWYWAGLRSLPPSDLEPDDPRLRPEPPNLPEELKQVRRDAVEHARQSRERVYEMRRRAFRNVIVLASMVLAIGCALAAVAILVLDL
jgi:hypothetical protein